MKLHLYGGFAEKGRTCLGIEANGTAILLDCGINTSDRANAYYPAIAPEALRRQTALLITHAHEDHVGALGWCVANGFAGSLHMTAETRAEAPETLAHYAAPAEAGVLEHVDASIFSPGETLRIGALTITTGRSGHAVGGVWFAVSDGTARATYCGDVVPGSQVLSMDPLPMAEALVFDASYGADPVSAAARAAALAAWVHAHPGPAILPTPLSGRSLDLLLAVPEPLWIHASMRPALRDQINARTWLKASAATALQMRLGAATDWSDGMPLPPGPLLCHDGMGMEGPSAALLARAEAEHVPVLLTGHLPHGSPGALMQKAGLADWIRIPTHPTLPETQALVRDTRPRIALGHSCSPDDLRALATVMPSSLRQHRTGDTVDI